MSGAEPRQLGAIRTEYPAIRPGDKPRGLNSKPAAPRALAEKPANSLNVSANTKNALQTKPALKTDSRKLQPKQAVKDAKPKVQSKPLVKTDAPQAPAKPVVRQSEAKLQTKSAVENNESKDPTKSTVQNDLPKTQTQGTVKDGEPKATTKPSKKRSSTSNDNGPSTKKAKVDRPATSEPSESQSEPPIKKASTKKTKVDKASTEKTKPASETPTEKPSSFLEITLPTHPTTGEVPIYDTCSTIRQKISALLGKDNNKPENGVPGQFKKDGTPKPYTQAQFLRDIEGGSAATLKTFMAAKNLMGGAESPVYPCAYAFFEKKRIWEDGKKTSRRKKVEEDRPNGLPLRDPNHMRIWVRAGENPSGFLDEYGQ